MLPPCWKRVAAAPHYRATHLRRAAGKPLSKHVATSQALADVPSTRPRSTTFGRRIRRKLSWPNGQGVALQGRRLRVRVPLGAPSTRRVMKKINAKKKHEGRPVRFLTAVGAKKSERQFNQERNHYALSAKTGRCQRRFYGRRRDQDSTRRRRAARATIGAHASAKRRRRRPARAARCATRSSRWRAHRDYSAGAAVLAFLAPCGLEADFLRFLDIVLNSFRSILTPKSMSWSFCASSPALMISMARGT